MPFESLPSNDLVECQRWNWYAVESSLDFALGAVHIYPQLLTYGSRDGINWTGLNDGRPVFTEPDTGTGSTAINEPDLIFFNNAFYCIYSYLEVADNVQLGIARSSDLIHWERIAILDTGLTLGAGGYDNVFSPSFFLDATGILYVAFEASLHSSSSHEIFLCYFTDYTLTTLSAAVKIWEQPGTPVEIGPRTPYIRKVGSLYYLFVCWQIFAGANEVYYRTRADLAGLFDIATEVSLWTLGPSGFTGPYYWLSVHQLGATEWRICFCNAGVTSYIDSPNDWGMFRGTIQPCHGLRNSLTKLFHAR